MQVTGVIFVQSRNSQAALYCLYLQLTSAVPSVRALLQFDAPHLTLLLTALLNYLVSEIFNSFLI